MIIKLMFSEIFFKKKNLEQHPVHLCIYSVIPTVTSRICEYMYQEAN